LSARWDARQRPRLLAGIGGKKELDLVTAGRSEGASVAHADLEARSLERELPQLAFHSLLELAGRPAARGARGLGRLPRLAVGLSDGGPERRHAALALGSPLQLAGERVAPRDEIRDAAAVLLLQARELGQPALHRLQPRRIGCQRPRVPAELGSR